MDPGRTTEGQFRLEQRFKDQVYGSGSMSDHTQKLWRSHRGRFEVYRQIGRG